MLNIIYYLYYIKNNFTANINTIEEVCQNVCESSNCKDAGNILIFCNTNICFINIFKVYTYQSDLLIVHFDTGAEGDYLAHVTFFATSKASEKSHMS